MHLGDINYINPITGVGAYRWYMEIEDRESVYGINNNNTAKEISIRVVGEETTGIANIQLSSPNTQTYDLNGRRVNENNECMSRTEGNSWLGKAPTCVGWFGKQIAGKLESVNYNRLEVRTAKDFRL